MAGWSLNPAPKTVMFWKQSAAFGRRFFVRELVDAGNPASVFSLWQSTERSVDNFHLTKTHERAPATLWPFHVALVVFVVLAILSAAQGMGLAHYTKEDGPFEIGALAALLCAALGFVALAPRMAFGPGWHVTVLLLLLVGRELDFDKRFTDKGILQIRLYSGDYPLMQKLIGAAVIALTLTALYRCVRCGARPLMTGLRHGSPWAWWLSGAVVLVVIAKSLDGLARKLAPFGVEISDNAMFWAGLVEEGFELVFGLMLIMAVCTWVRDHGRA